MVKSADFLADLGAEPERYVPRQKKTPTVKKKNDPIMDGGLMKRFSLSALVKNHARELMIMAGVTALVGTSLVNALFLQTGKHPAPLFAASETPQVSTVTTAAIPKPREIILTKQDRPVSADPLVVEIQRHLSARGYYNSDIDGLMGARTKAAIGLYQRAFGEAVTNEASRPLLEHIRLSNPDRKYHAKARKRVADEAKKVQAPVVAVEGPVVVRSTIESDDIINDPERIKQVQRALSQLGFRLVADGVAGRNTRSAIVEFKKQRGLVPDGDITVALFNELIKLKQL